MDEHDIDIAARRLMTEVDVLDALTQDGYLGLILDVGVDIYS